MDEDKKAADSSLSARHSAVIHALRSGGYDLGTCSVGIVVETRTAGMTLVSARPQFLRDISWAWIALNGALKTVSGQDGPTGGESQRITSFTIPRRDPELDEG